MTPNNRFKQIREKYRLTQEQFAEKLELKKAKVNHIEAGNQKVSMEIAMKVQEVFPDEDWLWIVTGEYYKPIADKEVQEVAEMYQRALEGDLELAKKLQQRLFGLVAVLERKKKA